MTFALVSSSILTMAVLKLLRMIACVVLSSEYVIKHTNELE